ncbi:general amidase [Amylocystis lapponica]|nr:general amidase [Amylocystis lapponica]
MPEPAQDWKARCAARKAKQHDDIPSQWLIDPSPFNRQNVLGVPASCGLLSARELEITDTDDVDLLLANLRTAKWSSVEVTTAFYKRALVAHQLTNCLTEIFVDRALARASEVDRYLKDTGKVIGPLHGLPISLKDQFCIKGLETIMGYAGWIGRYAQSDCVLVQILYECGAVPFVRTNVPQTLQWGETYNSVFGRTTNPHNRYMTPAAPPAARGTYPALLDPPFSASPRHSSVRIPSAFCGLYSLRPSYERLPYCGALNAQQGQESVSSTLGPMANSLAAVKVFVKAVIDAKPWRRDPLAVRKDWSDREYALAEHGTGRKMCFAIMWHNGVIKPQPPILRGMQVVKKALEAAGHTVIDWENHRHLELYEVVERIFAADDGHDYLTQCALSGEPLLQTMSPTTDKHEYALDEPFARTIVGERRHLSAYELWQLHHEKRALRKSYLDHWEATAARTGTGRPVDAIISPVAPYTACPHGCNSDAFYTTLCNALDYTCATFPVTSANRDVDVVQPPHEFRNHEDEAVYKLYDPELFHGMPVGLQLIGRPFEEEGVIAMTEVVDKA